MKKHMKILILIYTIFYLYSIASLIKYNIWFTASFWFYELLFKSFLHFLLIGIIFFYWVKFLEKRSKTPKIFLGIIFIFFLSNFYYAYNSFPTVQVIKLINQKEISIEVKIDPIYLFDKSFNKELWSNENMSFIIFWWWEYQLLSNRTFTIKWYFEWNEIYKKDLMTNDIVNGIEIQPEIIIN